MNTMMLLVLLASVCHEIQPNIAEEVNSSFRNIPGGFTNLGCRITVSSCMEFLPLLIKACRVCGKINPGVKTIIIEGNTVNPQHQFPWMVSLMYFDQHYCGGSIISDSYILTAAHCLEHEEISDFQKNIKIGFLSPTGRVTSGYDIESAIMHPNYTSTKGIYFDIGLIKLKDKITCDEYKLPVCLPPANIRLNLNTALTIMGWGMFRQYKNVTSEKLLSATVSVTNRTKCRRTITDDYYCLVGQRRDQGLCLGDSGGPAIYQRNKKYFSVGVASFVHPDCIPGSEFGYTNVAYVMHWITGITGVKSENFD